MSKNESFFDKSRITILRNRIFEMYDQKMVEKSNTPKFTGLRTDLLSHKWL